MGKKGKKKNKKQLEDELNRQQEEQKRKEEQERLQKVEEDAWKKQQDRVVAELDAKNRIEEAERLEEESSIVASMKGERKKNLEYENQKLQDKIDWNKFVSCTSRPNVIFENEITTYMTMVREETVDQIEEALKKCHQSEEIVGDLMEQYCKAREEGDVQRQDWCMHYINQIRNLEIEKIDDATAHLLQYIEEQDANSRSEVQITWGGKDDRIKIGFWGHLQSKGFRAKVIDHHKIQVVLELPKSIALQSMGHCIGVRTLYTAYDSFRGKDPSQMSVGGMIRVDLLSIPPFSKKVKGWTMRQIPPPGEELTRLAYPNSDHAQTSSSGALQPCKIEYKVPAHVLVRKNPTISWWDTQAEQWSTDNIGEITWESETRKISFFSQRLAAFSITQERHLDLPYQWWNLRPIAPMQAELTVQAARYELHFVITEQGLRLKGPELPELQSLMFTEVSPAKEDGTPAVREPRVQSPATLLWELRECGMNLMPEDADAEFLPDYVPKCPETEARAYSDLSEVAAYYDIASSKHNKKLSPEVALVRIRENPHYEEYDPLDPDSETDYTSVMFFPDKSSFVKSLESVPNEAVLRGESNSEALLKGHLTHASFYLCFDKHPNPGANHPDLLQKLEVTCSNVRFIEAIRQTMALMRLLSFV